MVNQPSDQNLSDEDVIRLEQAYKKLVAELELFVKKGKALKEEAEQAINHKQMQAVLHKIKNIKTE